MTSSSSAASARVAKLQIDPTGTRERFFRGLLFKIHREKKISNLVQSSQSFSFVRTVCQCTAALADNASPITIVWRMFLPTTLWRIRIVS